MVADIQGAVGQGAEGSGGSRLWKLISKGQWVRGQRVQEEVGCGS